MSLKNRIIKAEQFIAGEISTPSDSPMAGIAHQFFPDLSLSKRDAPLLAIDILKNGGDPQSPSDRVKEVAFQDFLNRR